MNFAETLACPMDGMPLVRAEGLALRCTRGHSFDRARAGYYNLLVVQHKASLDPGDSRDMVAARQRFLTAGHYAPIAGRTAQLAADIATAASPRAPFRILDAGCGEGYYLDHVARALSRDPSPVELAGIDISKWAMIAALKRTRAITPPGGAASPFWAVASNRHLPFAEGSIGLILSLFGFPVWDAFAAVQPDGGHVLLVDPGPAHLIELREVIYPTVTRAAPPSLEAALRAGYRLEREDRLQFQFDLAHQAQIADLLAMTPHNHRAPRAGRAALASLDTLTVSADLMFRLLRRESL